MVHKIQKIELCLICASIFVIILAILINAHAQTVIPADTSAIIAKIPVQNRVAMINFDDAWTAQFTLAIIPNILRNSRHKRLSYNTISIIQCNMKGYCSVISSYIYQR